MHAEMTRGWQDYWDWKDKAVKECGAVKDVLEAAGVKFTGLRSCEDDHQTAKHLLMTNGQASNTANSFARKILS